MHYGQEVVSNSPPAVHGAVGGHAEARGHVEGQRSHGEVHAVRQRVEEPEEPRELLSELNF